MQSGWLRASHRALDAAASTELHPGADVHEGRRRAAARRAKLSLVRVPLFPFGHAFRAGSRIRIVGAAAGRQPAVVGVRRADTRSGAEPVDGVAVEAQPSTVVLPVVSGRRRADAAARVRQRCGASRAATTSPLANGAERSSTESARLRARRRTTSSASPRSIRSRATGEGITGHDHEMTDYSPDGVDERAEHDRATLRALDAADDRRPTPTASPPT